MPHPQRRHPSASRRRDPLRRAAAVAAGTLTASLLVPAAAGATAAGATAAGTAVKNGRAGASTSPPDYDARTVTAAGHAGVAAEQVTTGAAAAFRRSLGSQGVLDVDPLTGTPREVARLDGALTARSSRPAAEIALDYVRAHAAGLGLDRADLATLHRSRDYVDVTGTHHLSWVQRLHGVPVFGNGLQASVAKDGRLINLLGSPLHGLAGASLPGRTLSAAAAMATAKRALGAAGTAPGSRDRSREVLFATADGLHRGYEAITLSVARPSLQVLDGTSGRVLYRHSLVDDEAATTISAAAAKTTSRGLAFQFFPGAPRGGVQERINFTARGWLPAGADELSGNNTHTYADVNDDNRANPNEEVPPSSAHSWDYRLTPFKLAGVSFCGHPWPCSWNPDQAWSWQTNRNQNATQVFSFVNSFHDHLAARPIGFTEAAGNFQAVNHSGRGEGGDAVQAQSDDGANTDHGLPDGGHVDNANMSTPPDGQAPTMQMYLQHTPGTSYPDEDPFSPTNVGDEADTVYHEYTHGLSNRLVVDAAGRSTLSSEQSGSMGEAWSDWYAMDYLVDQGLQVDRPKSGDVLLFAYDGVGAKTADRTQPIDCAVGTTSPACPGTDTAGPGGYTYGDLGRVIGFPEVHADGEIWAETLWDLRRALGSTVAESLVTRAMELSPASPSFLDERNAILQADVAVYDGGYAHRIWSVFTHRGMGFFAATAGGDDTSPAEDFSLPPAPGAAHGAIEGTVRDSRTGEPVAGVTVSLAGHDSGFPGDFADTTDARGRYRIADVPAGTYREVTVSGPGYIPVTTTFTVTRTGLTRNFTVTRDWAAASGGASVTSFTGVDYSDYGCGPAGAIDLSLGSGWGSTSDLTASGQSTAKTAKYLVVRLPAAVDVSAFAVDPGATCGDDDTASTAGYRIQTSTDGKTWRTASSGTFTAADNHRLNRLTPVAGAAHGVRWVRFGMLSPQVVDGGSCPGSSGCSFLDMSELEVYGSN